MRARRWLALLTAWGGAGLEARAAEGGAGGAALLMPQLGTIFWTVVTFVALILLLRRFAWGPLLGAIDAREQSIRESLERARTDREQSDALVRQSEQQLLAARRERAEALELGRRDAERLKDEILEQARQQREQLLVQGEAQLEAALRRARGELRADVAGLAILAAGRLLGRNLDEATHRELVEEHLSELEGSARKGGRPAPS